MAEPEQQVVNKIWGHKMTGEYKGRYWLVNKETFNVLSEFLI